MLFLLFQNIDVAHLDQLAQTRDAAALTQYLAAVPKHNPFDVIKTGGAYAAGQRGWHALPLTTPDGDKYVVFSTPIIEEDMGELLFKITPGGKLQYMPESDGMGATVVSHNFDIRFDLANHKLIATDHIIGSRSRAAGGNPNEMQYRTEANRGPGISPTIFFRMSPTYTVRSITNTVGTPIPYQQAGGIVAVQPKSASFSFTVKYDGTNLMPAFDRLIGPKEATLSASVWYLTIARHPAPYDITMHSPKNWTALAQGDLVSDTVVGNDRITKFHNPIPVVWYSASEGPYKTVTTKIDGREYATMSATMTEDEMAMQNTLNAEVINFYSKSFMPYPFKRWTSLDSWQFHGGPGALEAYSFATYPGGLPGQDSHEPSHCWWGGILDNDYLHSLWNESFADYCQGLFARNRVAGNKEELSKAFVSQPFAGDIYNAAPLSDSGDEIGPAAAALGYGKGAFVLQMLEDEIGTDTMISAMSQWIKTNPSRHIGHWEDFEKVVDSVTGKDYKWFFDEWVRRPGYANMSLSDVAWNNGQLTGRITFKGDPYKIHADILMRMRDGSDQYGRIDTMETKDGDGYKFSVACQSQPDLITIDPWGKILRAASSSETRPNLVQPLFRFKTFVDPAHPDYLKLIRSRTAIDALPADLADTIIIGSPETLPAMKPLCDQVGFEVSGNTLTYQGTKIDLNHGGAIAIVDLPNGKQCMIGLGTCKLGPDMGQARLLILDELGRPVRAKTDPATGGPLSYAFVSK